MSRARDLADSADKDIVGTLTVDGITVDGTADATTVEFDNLSGTGAISVTDILDQDDMSSDSATALATQQSIKAYVDTEVAGIVDAAPSTLDTLNELAAALGDDVNFSTTVTNSIATKLPLAGGTLSGALDVNATVTADKVDIGNGVAGGTSEILFSDNVSSRGKIIYDHSSNPETLVLQTTGTTALSIDNSQNISIPTGDLAIGSGQADAVILELSNTDSVSNGLQIQLSGNGKDVYFWNHENAATAFATNNIQRMTISSGGDVLFGTTDTSPANNSANSTADNGTVIGGGLVMSAAYKSSAGAGSVGYFNRTGTDGPVVQLFKSGTAVGSIGTNSSAPYLATAVGSTLCGIKAQGGSTPRISPTDGDGAVSNGVTNLGATDARWKDLFIGGDIGHLDNGGNARLLYDKSANLLGNTGTNVTGATVTSSGQIKVTGSNASTVAFSVGDAGTGFFNTGSNSIGLSTGGTESLRVDGNGNLLVGTTAAPVSAGLDGVQIYNASTGTQGRINFGKSTTSTVNAIANYNNSGTGTAGYVGGVTYSNTATAFPTSSDQRLKENITNADSAITTINGIQVRKYDWISNSEHERYGLVAQELNDIVPEAVCRNVEEDTWAVDYSKLVPMLTKALQESLARIETLEAAVTVLQGE